MRISEALEKVSSKYIPGAVAFFEKMKPNPWQLAHDRFEGALAFSTADNFEEHMTAASEEFVDQCLKLLEMFAMMNGTKKQVPSFVDAFNIGDEQQFMNFHSDALNVCRLCGGGKDVRACINPADMTHGLHCIDCVR